MSDEMLQNSELWRLVDAQHGVIARAQLLGFGISPSAIAHKTRNGRLHRMQRGVYAVGRPHVTQLGRWMATVLACGPGAGLSHTSAGVLWEMISFLETNHPHVSVPTDVYRRVPGVVLHRRTHLADALTSHHGVPVTNPVATLVDLATILTARQLETAINEADKLGLVSPEQLRSSLEEPGLQRGAPAIRTVLDRHTFALTDSELERRFLPIARSVGLPLPETGRRVNGFKVDFFWPDLSLVVETDGLRYHRTAAAQARDRLRDQAHAAAGMTCLRFTHAQVKNDLPHVRRTLAAVAERVIAARLPP